jgi:hypothetical protein
MAINAAPVVSTQIYLGDLTSSVKEMEGDCDQADRAWVIIRQSTEGDNRRISEMSAETRTVWSDTATEQIRRINQAEVRALQVYLTLSDMGNVFADDAGKKPLFRFENGKLKMPKSEFQKAYDGLHPEVTRAIILAVYQTNPMWDWSIDQQIRCPECSAEFEVDDKHLVPLVGKAELEPPNS